jgi:uronate dehydrogenase
MKERILVTGPGGRVGKEIVPLLREHYALRLLDAAPLQQIQLAADDDFVPGDIRDLATIREACRGVTAMVHLAAISDEDDFHTKLLPMNLEGVYNAFEAARQAGLKKVIFASTGQTVLGYPKGERVTTEMPARPSTVYACTKLFGEALARQYSDRHGMSMIVIRLCWFQPYDSELLREPGDIQREWCSPRDLTQLLVKAIRTPLPFGVFFGLSKNTNRCWDIDNATELLGYAPEDDAASYLT